MNKTMKDGIRLYSDKKYEDSLVVFLSLPTGSGIDNLEISYFVGLCYAQLKRYEDALVYLEQVVTSDADLARVYQCRMLLAIIYSKSGRLRLADFELNKLIELGYESCQVFSSLGFVAYSTDRIEEAIQWYEKALGLHPNNATAMNGLGFILADTDTDFTRSLSLCKKAVDLDPENPAYLDSLGWVYHKLGLTSEAKMYTKRAQQQDPTNSIIKTHLKEILGEKGAR